MFDVEVCRLVHDVKSGHLNALAALMDRQYETHDSRSPELVRMVARLTNQSDIIALTDDKGWRGRSPEEKAANRDRACREIWLDFSNQFSELYWAELSGKDCTINMLADIETTLRTVTQAERLEQPDDDDENMSEGMDEENPQDRRLYEARSMRKQSRPNYNMGGDRFA